MNKKKEALEALNDIEKLLDTVIFLAKESKERNGVEALAEWKLKEQVDKISEALQQPEYKALCDKLVNFVNNYFLQHQDRIKTYEDYLLIKDTLTKYQEMKDKDNG